MFTEKDALIYRENKWAPIPRLSRNRSFIPFGYQYDPEDPDILLPIELELEALEKAKQHLKQFSYREVAAWLTKITGRKISHEGLRKRLKIERTRRTKAHALKLLAKRLEETQKAVEHLEQKTLGARISQDSGTT